MFVPVGLSRGDGPPSADNLHLVVHVPRAAALEWRAATEDGNVVQDWVEADSLNANGYFEIPLRPLPAPVGGSDPPDKVLNIRMVWRIRGRPNEFRGPEEIRVLRW